MRKAMLTKLVAMAVLGGLAIQAGAYASGESEIEESEAQLAAAAEYGTIEMEVNHTPATNDDIVGGNEVTSCRLRLVGADQGIGATVTLSAADVPGKGLVDFEYPNGSSLYLNSDGTWQYVMIKGVRGSAAINDARINIHRARFSYEGSPIFPDTHKDATVFWFNPTKIEVTSGDPYSFIDDDLKPITDDPREAIAVKMTARHKVQPEGVDCSAPQLANRHVGIVQNVMSDTRSSTFSAPRPLWLPAAVAGEQITVTKAWYHTITLPGQALDVAEGAGSGPLYNSSASVCVGEYTTDDSPITTDIVLDYTIEFWKDGRHVANVVYDTTTMNINASFVTWAVDHNTSNNTVNQLLREIPWSLNISWVHPGENPTNQKATTQANDESPMTAVVLSPPTANTLMSDPANRRLGSDMETQDFTNGP